MTFEGAIIQEQGIRFAIVIVKRHVVQSSTAAKRATNSFTPHFGGVPVILMAQDHRGIPTYFGRNDIVRFLSRVPLEAIPWRRFNLN